MKKAETTSTFEQGMIMDLNPLTTPNSVLTSCLNGTLVTFQGNENVLQVDMGNGRVETARLPEGYIPLGTAELGGIIYIVSYNPLRGTCQIGSFPSPERNITTDELGSAQSLDISNFFSKENNKIKYISANDSSGDEREFPCVITPIQRLKFEEATLNPGDKFLIYDTVDYLVNNTGVISSIYTDSSKINNNPDLYPKYLKLSVISIDELGKITNLNDTLLWGDLNGEGEEKYEYYLSSGTVEQDDQGKLSIEEYHNLIYSNYNTYQSKSSGTLGLLAELEAIDNFQVTWTARKVDTNWVVLPYVNWTYSNTESAPFINPIGIVVQWQDSTGTKSKYIEFKQYPMLNSQGKIVQNYLEIEKNTYINYLDIQNNSNHEYIPLTPYYYDGYKNPNYVVSSGISNGGVVTPRYNDGTDNFFFVNSGTDNLVKIPTSEKGIITFTVYPVMPYGILEYQKREFTVNFDKLGTGEFNLSKYQYYCNTDTNTITLNWSLEAYPELNKEIVDINIQFYTYNSTIGDKISDFVGKNIAHTQIETNTTSYWNIDSIEFLNGRATSGNNTEEQYLAGLGTPQYQLNVSKAVSYAGDHSEIITELTPNSLYFVVFNIVYGDKGNTEGETYSYVRFLYTNGIFNDAYNTNIDDFNKLVLQDYLDFECVVSNLNQEDKSLESKAKYNWVSECTGDKSDDDWVENYANLTTSLDEYNDSNTIWKYTFGQELETHISFAPKVEPKTPGFTVEFGASHTPKINTNNIIYENDAQQTRIEQNVTSPDLENLPSVFVGTASDGEGPILDVEISEDKTESSLKYENGKISFDFKTYILTPFKVEYSYFTQIPISYIFQPLSIRCGFLLIHGKEDGDDAISLYYTDIYQGTPAGDKFGDDAEGRHSYRLDEYPVTYNKLKGFLEEVDIVALKMGLTIQSKTNNESHEGRWIELGRADISSWDAKGHLSNSDRWNFSDDNNPPIGYFPGYAFKTTDGKIRIICFCLPWTTLSSDSAYSKAKWYDTSVLQQNPFHTYYTYNPRPFLLPYVWSNGDPTTGDEEVLKQPFKYYYKATSTDDSKDSYKWSRITYYNQYNWKAIVPINIETQTTDKRFHIKVNGYELFGYSASTDEVTTHYPSNIACNGPSELYNVEITGTTNLDQYVNQLLYPSQYPYVKVIEDGDESIQRLNISSNRVYAYQNDEITTLAYLKQSNGQSGEIIKDLKDCTVTQLIVSNGQVQLQLGSIPEKNQFSFMGKSCEEWLSINNMIKVNTE